MKIKWLWLVILIGILLLAGAVASKGVGRSPELMQFYSSTNTNYFNGTLPQVLVLLDDTENPANLGETNPCGEHCYVISVFSYWVPDANEQKMTVLHEMCHIYLDEESVQELTAHGPKFKACMRKLASEGAFDSLW